MTERFDQGLQPERTELAWRRTSLAIAAGSLVAMRLLPEILGSAIWALVGVAGLIAAVILWLGARLRYRRANIALSLYGEHAILPDGTLILALTALAVAIGLAGIALVLAAGLGIP